MEKQTDIINGEVADTYGGDFTYKYVYAIEDDNGVTFYEYYLGAKHKDEFVVDDPNDISEYMYMYESILKERKESLEKPPKLYGILDTFHPFIHGDKTPEVRSDHPAWNGDIAEFFRWCGQHGALDKWYEIEGE